ncbi:hypothetical protein, partial [Streptomyces naganishii]|uniref:hypothetical protein n=1 Tax=Streptomyces naganishii TaxID=285447 RepID=UPI001E4EBDAC
GHAHGTALPGPVLLTRVPSQGSEFGDLAGRYVEAPAHAAAADPIQGGRRRAPGRASVASATRTGRPCPDPCF